MRLTVIMPLYNRQDLVEKSLLSLLRQRDVCDLDLLVVNDDSTDDGPARVCSLARRHPEIRLVTTPNQGVTKARNVGLANIPTGCDLVTFLDSDDISPADRLRADLAAFDEEPAIQFTYGRMTLVDEFEADTFEPRAGSPTATVRGIQLSSGLYRTSFMRQIGTFNEAFPQAEDTDYLFRVFENGCPHRLTETVCVYYRQHPGNMTRNTAVARRCFIQAVHQSLARRRRNPSLMMPENVFDMNALMRARAA